MYLGQVVVFPIKSLDGIAVKEARIAKNGSLENDRIYAIVDEAGRFVNGKRTARIHLLRSAYDECLREVCLWQNGESSNERFSLDDSDRLNDWLSDFFGFPVKLIYDPKAGFPDDRTAYGPTIISEASLREVSSWFPELTFENAQRRFRTNLQVGEVPPFWEDCLFGAPGKLMSFQVGEVQFLGHNPCQRCVVPSRDPDNGDSTAKFQKLFMEYRKQTLPKWADVRQFNHYYRLAVNTSIPLSEVGKRVSVGDRIQTNACT
jgi:uncharacterized protein